ncbi:NACHT, LRR and PYD domains-containing protein 3-like isoform X2 [Sardina pilchardus]|uniref:NACHT, LRR and PYD domains-containing protein 3-like isoform X2 n=1 Tax=Sardina pilchardus TaxID=27697 RepID=UPI002E14CFF5
MSDIGDHKQEDASGEVNFHTRNETQDQSGKRQPDRPLSPSFTINSLKSDRSKGIPVNFSTDDKQPDTPLSPSFTINSLKSDRSKGFPVNFSTGDKQRDRPPSPTVTITSLKSDRSKGFPVNFSTDDNSQDKNESTGCFIKGVPDIQHQTEFTDTTALFQKSHKDWMTRKFKTLSEGPSTHTTPILLNEIYTELYITEVESEEVNEEHEIRQIEKASRTAIEDRPISCNDIFKPLPGQHQTIKTVLTVGVAGIGKTVSVHKFILDWAEGKTNEDIQFIFPLPFRELNLLKEKKLSLLDLLEHFFSKMKDLSPVFTSSKHKVMFIFDGLDECRIPLDFQSNPKCSDVTEPVSVDVLLTNLIKGNLLSSALLWITTRPAAANQIPPASTDLVTEIRGFNDPQKEEYLMKKISSEDLANRTITYLRSSRSLYIMCHIPVFCWITATVLERMLSGTENVEIPRTLTQVYVHFLTIQIDIKNVKYSEKQKANDTDEDMIFRLGKLGFQQLEKGNLIFYEEDLRECGIDVTEASVYSGVCTQIFREEAGWTRLYQGKVFSFVHLSIQEFLAALYVFLCFSNRDRTEKTIPVQQHTSQLSALFRAATLHDLHKTAVDLALQSRNGHLDLFLRFLLGLSLESNQKLLQKLLKNRVVSMEKEETVEYLKSNIQEKNPVESILNLFHCLNELGDTSLVEDMQRSLLSGKRPWPGDQPHSFHECASLQYLLLTAAEGQYDFNHNTIIKRDGCVEKLLPVIKVTRKAQLEDCFLTAESCELLASVLTQSSCLVRELVFSDNKIGDAGVKILSMALTNPKCKLESLWLKNCSLTKSSCECLASVLSCSSSLRQLDLSGNRIQDAGVELLTDVLKTTNCTLQELRLNNCGLTDESCASLASALRSNPSHLRELHLSGNTLRESGEKLLEALQKNPRNSLKSLTTKPQKSHCWDQQ